MSIYKKLSIIQNFLAVPKNNRNDFGKYNYRSCEDILEKVKPLCGENEATLTLSDSIELIGDRYYLVANARLTDWENGEYVEVRAMARESLTKKGMDDSQITGTASSYARKYALNGLFNIDDTNDADTNAFREEIKKHEQVAEKQLEQNIKIINDYVKQYTIASIKPLLNGKTSKTMTLEDTIEAISNIKQWLATIEYDEETGEVLNDTEYDPLGGM